MSRRVISLQKEPLADAVYVGRANPRRGLAGSIFANPYRVDVDGTREEVIEEYRQHVLGRHDLLQRLHDLRGRRLACWCHPAACHGDVLAALVDADEVLDDLQAAGVTVEAVDGRLRLMPATRVDEALAGRVRLHKPAILSLLAARSRLAVRGDRETPEQARQRQAAAIERLRLDRERWIAAAKAGSSSATQGSVDS
jgi:hypothetical protein